MNIIAMPFVLLAVYGVSWLLYRWLWGPFVKTSPERDGCPADPPCNYNWREFPETSEKRDKDG